MRQAADSRGDGVSVRPYQVMVVEDATVIRALINRLLDEDPEIEVAASVGHGEMALAALRRHPEIDVVLLDIDMPVMDGITALPKLLEIKPDLQVIMNSTLTRANARISLEALSKGAADYLTKPSTGAELRSAGDFARDIVEKVKALGAAARGGGAAPAVPAGRVGTAPKAAAQDQITLRDGLVPHPDAIAIGSSTGGPQALFAILAGLGGLPQPIFITQHMPPTFTAVLAEHIERQTGLTCREATDGTPVSQAQVHVAAGDTHMLAERGPGGPVLRLSNGPPENYCRPAVDPMLRSLTDLYGARLLVLILTGMGSDGCKGAEVVVGAGGAVIAQDEATSVVWGMPGAVASAGLCTAVLPLTEIAPYIRKLAMRSAA